MGVQMEGMDQQLPVVDYATVVKEYAETPAGRSRYSPPHVVSVEKDDIPNQAGGRRLFQPLRIPALLAGEEHRHRNEQEDRVRGPRRHHWR
jgi:hypothetical protein